jgi:hypothetical protein
MSATRVLTEFQQECEAELCSALAARNQALTERILAGETETYICASVSGTDIIVYIYEDAAQSHRGGEVAGRFEHQDFSDGDELKKAFIYGVIHANDS